MLKIKQNKKIISLSFKMLYQLMFILVQVTFFYDFSLS